MKILIPKTQTPLISTIIALLLICPAWAHAKNCIGLVTSSATDLHWSYVREGALAAARTLGYELYIRGAVSELNINAQRNIIKDIEDYQCLGLVIAPNHISRAQDVSRLKAKGIPTVFIDRDTGQADVIAVLATDNFAAGQYAARQMAAAIGTGGNVLLMRLDKNIESTTKREQGFISEAIKLKLNIVDAIYLGTRIGDIRSRTIQYFTKNTKAIDGIFTVNESTTMGVLLALPRTRQSTVFIGFDIRNEFIEYIKQGVLYGVIVQKGYEMGYQAVELIDQYTKEPPWKNKKNIPLAIDFITKENLKKFQLNTRSVRH